MKKTCTNLVFISMLITFASIFIFARAFISISFVVVILMCLLNKNAIRQLKNSLALKSFLISAVLINIGMFYVLFLNDTVNLKTILSFSNPILVLLYICSASYFLSTNKKYANYLINFFISLVTIFSIYALSIFIYKKLHGQDFIVSTIYASVNGGSAIQSIVALTFPLSAVIIINKTINSNLKLCYKTFPILVALCIILVDLFINRSKAGYIIEFVILVYYSYMLITKYFFGRYNLGVIKRITLCFIALAIFANGTTLIYKKSDIFHARVSQATHDFNKFFSKDYNKEINLHLEKTSTGLRLLYYVSSVKVFKEYPSILLFGCPLIQKNANPTECTKELIANSKLKDDIRIVHNGIMAHDEFINYTFRGGLIAGICLLIFFIALFFNDSKKLSQDSMLYLKVLTMAMFIGCCFDYFITIQITVVLFASLCAIFMSKKRE